MADVAVSASSAAFRLLDFTAREESVCLKAFLFSKPPLRALPETLPFSFRLLPSFVFTVLATSQRNFLRPLRVFSVQRAATPPLD